MLIASFLLPGLLCDRYYLMQYTSDNVICPSSEVRLIRLTHESDFNLPTSFSAEGLLVLMIIAQVGVGCWSAETMRVGLVLPHKCVQSIHKRYFRL